MVRKAKKAGGCVGGGAGLEVSRAIKRHATKKHEAIIKPRPTHPKPRLKRAG